MMTRLILNRRIPFVVRLLIAAALDAAALLVLRGWRHVEPRP